MEEMESVFLDLYRHRLLMFWDVVSSSHLIVMYVYLLKELFVVIQVWMLFYDFFKKFLSINMGPLKTPVISVATADMSDRSCSLIGL